MEIVEEDNYYPFGLKHKGYNHSSVSDANTTAQKYKYNGMELQDELGLGWYDYQARNYDPALGRWFNVDPLAEKSRRWSPYTYALDNPVFFIDPDGMEATAANLDMESELDTDFTFDQKTGEVKQVGEANDKPDRIVKTNSKGEVKYDKKGNPKVAIDNIEKGILKDGMNLKTNDNMISVGGEGQPTVEGVEKFALELSEYVGKEIGGTYFSKDGADKTTHMTLGKYKDNTLTRTNAHGSNLRDFVTSIEELQSFKLTGFFHTHPNTMTHVAGDHTKPSDQDNRVRNFHPQIKSYIISRPYRGTGNYLKTSY